MTKIKMKNTIEYPKKELAIHIQTQHISMKTKFKLKKFP